MTLLNADLEQLAAAGDTAAQLRLAARHDCEGRHTDAIDWLARAAKAGDARALFELGRRLLTGDDAPWRPEAAAGLLVDAAARGDAEAAALVSILAGGGFHGPQNWAVAFDHLQRAAELGLPSAREQLRLLSEDEALRTAPAAADLWGRLRRSIDLGWWTRPATADVICGEPLVRTITGLVPPRICDWITDQSRPRLTRAQVHDPETGQAIMGETRTNRVANFGLVDTSLLNLLVQARFAAAAGFPLAMMEAFAVLHYAIGEEASEHYDYLDPDIPAYAAQIAEMGQRVATGLLYLNDGYEGGETAFPRLGIGHKGRKGDALIFLGVARAGAPDPRSLHAGRAPAAGEKWVLSQFMRTRPRVGAGAVRS